MSALPSKALKLSRLPALVDPKTAPTSTAPWPPHAMRSRDLFPGSADGLRKPQFVAAWCSTENTIHACLPHGGSAEHFAASLIRTCLIDVLDPNGLAVDASVHTIARAERLSS